MILLFVWCRAWPWNVSSGEHLPLPVTTYSSRKFNLHHSLNYIEIINTFILFLYKVAANVGLSESMGFSLKIWWVFKHSACHCYVPVRPKEWCDAVFSSCWHIVHAFITENQQSVLLITNNNKSEGSGQCVFLKKANVNHSAETLLLLFFIFLLACKLL